jgi:acyl dehydratase
MTDASIPVGFTFDTIAVGQRARSSARTVTETDHSLFMMLTGAWFPIHSDEGYAQAAGAKGRIVQGTFGLALAAGSHLESEVLQSADPLVAALGLQEWRYRAPIYIGDTLHLEVEVADKRLTGSGDRYIVDRRIKLVNQEGAIVQEGIARSMWRRRGDTTRPNN